MDNIPEQELDNYGVIIGYVDFVLSATKFRKTSELAPVRVDMVRRLTENGIAKKKVLLQITESLQYTHLYRLLIKHSIPKRQILILQN